MTAKDELGRHGEDIAVEYLERRGLVVLDRNWRCREGELDVVCVQGERLVVCEVKTRSCTRFGEPAEAVTPRKAVKVRRAAQAWLTTRGVGWTEVRFDVVAVVAEPGRPTTLQHFEAAF
ncbi:YraN family protein [Pseudonocardia sp.]|uniref:YraN family protein n=1 Tax=Pseudonocardia sp. TaxID=60912 RepID=UPI003D0C5D79